VGSHGSSSLPFVMKVMVCHFVSDSHEVMTSLIVVLPLIVVVEIALQLHQALGFRELSWIERNKSKLQVCMLLLLSLLCILTSSVFAG